MKNQCDKWVTTALPQPTEHATPETFLRFPAHLRLCFVTSIPVNIAKNAQKRREVWESVVLYCFIETTQELVLLANIRMRNLRIISFLPGLCDV